MIYLISDVHGRYEEFVRLLRKVRFRKTDQLYVLGDVIDRGENNLKMLDFCRLEENVTLLKGNHELFMQHYLEGSPWLREHWKSWGGNTTLRELEQTPEEKKEEYLQYLQGLPHWKCLRVNETDYFLTHSGFSVEIAEPVMREDGKINIEESVRLFVKLDEWAYLVSDDLHFLPASITFDRYIICGHYPTLEYRAEGGVYRTPKFTDIDCGCAWKQPSPHRRMACLCLDTGEVVYQKLRTVRM